ncbi:SDR family NAD(P)-dependent oxidoreductase [Roseicella aquatilis]|uniref:SDR family NAD(P)-dependent oxidoreductase n=1 Tax=Roseicella aquatilis TaxID=2527868 RepID=UPI0019825D99|nr:SDR family NAD(P)-dependent oxidoreductase [Roseicella aquatilis]
MGDLLTDRAAIITGATSGIGLGIAETLAVAGAAVMLNGFGEPAHIEEIRRNLDETISSTTNEARSSPSILQRPSTQSRRWCRGCMP